MAISAPVHSRRVGLLGFWRRQRWLERKKPPPPSLPLQKDTLWCAGRGGEEGGGDGWIHCKRSPLVPAGASLVGSCSPAERRAGRGHSSGAPLHPPASTLHHPSILHPPSSVLRPRRLPRTDWLPPSAPSAPPAASALSASWLLPFYAAPTMRRRTEQRGEGPRLVLDLNNTTG